MNWKSGGVYHWTWLLCLLLLTFSLTSCSGVTQEEEETEDFKHMRKTLENDIKILQQSTKWDALASRAKVSSGRGARKKRSNNCQPGYTGQFCENIVCTEKKVLASQGNQASEWLEYMTASNCRNMGNVTIYVDSYVTNRIDIRVMGQRKGLRPSITLYTPDGSEMSPQRTMHGATVSITQTYYTVVKDFGTGAFTLSVTSRAEMPCSLQVSAPSALVVDGGFVSTQQDDLAQELIMSNAVEGEDPLNGVPSYFALKVSGLPFPGMPFLVSYNKGSVQRLAISPVRPRYNCTTPMITTSLQVCTEPGDYKVKVIGLDDNANVWQRVYGYTCNFPPVPSTTPTSTNGGSGGSDSPPPDPIDTCYSGGTLIKNDNSQSAVCYCGVHFTGARCETKLCENGGVLDDDNNCMCPGDGAYSGAFCEHVNCHRPSGLQFVSSERAVIFVVRTSQAVANARDRIADAARRIIDYYERTSPGYIQKYVVVFFAGGEIQHEYEHDIKQNFVETDLRNMQHFVPQNEEDEKCTDIYSKSPIFLITDATPSDSVYKPQRLVWKIVFLQRAALYHSGDTDKCKTDTYSDAVKELRRISQFSQGLLGRTDFTQLENTHCWIRPGLKNWNQLISNDFLDSCKYAPSITNFFVDTSISNIAIVTAGGSLVCVNQRSNTDISVIDFPVTVAGNYRLELAKGSNLPCQFRVFVIGLQTACFQQTIPSSGSLQQYHLPDPENLFAEAIVWTNEAFSVNGSRTILYASNGIYRDTCDFNLYFRDWSCPRRGLLFYVNVYITDQSGYTIMRTANGICSSDVPAQQPSTGCINGGVDVDDNGKCFCPVGWTGTRCETIVCQNYGVSRGDYCECDASGTTTGTFCETLICDDPPAYVDKQPFDKDGTSLLLLVHDSFNTRPIISSMVDFISETMQDISMQSKNWIDTYTLATFSDRNFNDLVTSQNPNEIITALTDLNERNKNNGDMSCKDLLVFESLYAILADSAKTKKRGIVYIFLLGLPLTDQTLLDDLYLLVEEAQIQINIVQSSALICEYDITDREVRIFLELATATGGNFFVLNNQPGKALLTIPTLYSSSLIYENVYDDCSAGQKFYFPIDSQTQTFSVNLFARDLSVVDLWVDHGSHSRFQQILRPCDDGWVSFKSHCYLISDESRSWTDARSVCASSKSSLVTVFNADDQGFLAGKMSPDGEMWIGLIDLRAADSTTPEWQWDQPAGSPPLTLKDTSYAPWESSTEPNITSGSCVRSSKSGWKVADCSSSKRFACIRHSYDIDYSPRNGINVLPHGTWSLTVRTVDVGDDNGCAVRIFSQSAIQVFNRFTTNNRQDFGSGEPTTACENPT
uniref:Uncharacterized protein n=1 Tax=Ditylenchus dipsaci TaxID=166011 RepID=A0A915D9D6_9BILA